MSLWRAIAIWLILIVVESIHGILRAIFLVPVIGEFRSRQVGVFTGSFLILVVAYLFVRWLHADSMRSLLLVGVIWLVLTLYFEFGFGHFVFGRSWEDLSSDCNIVRGGLLPIGLLVLTLSPLIAARLHGLRS